MEQRRKRKGERTEEEAMRRGRVRGARGALVTGGDEAEFRTVSTGPILGRFFCFFFTPLVKLKPDRTRIDIVVANFTLLIDI